MSTATEAKAVDEPTVLWLIRKAWTEADASNGEKYANMAAEIVVELMAACEVTAKLPSKAFASVDDYFKAHDPSFIALIHAKGKS